MMFIKNAFMPFKRVSLFFLAVMSFSTLIFTHNLYGADGVHLKPEQQKWITKIEQKLETVQTLQADFRQIAADGRVTTGRVLLARPGRIRFTYDPPSPVKLVANQGQVVFEDTSIGQRTTLPLEHSPLGLLLLPHPHFSGDVTVTSFKQVEDQIQLGVVRTHHEGEGSLTLFFATNPFSLEGWDVLDPQGRKTHIRLLNQKEGVSIAEHVFDLPKEE